MHKYITTIILTLALALITINANAAGSKTLPPHQNWQSANIFGKYDKQAAQRGLQVFKEVCSTCHSLKLVAFRHLNALGYDENQIKNFASEFEVTDGPNDDGELFQRPALPSDFFPNPYANDAEARSVNNGALPPDLSLMVKARNHGYGNFAQNLIAAISGKGSSSGADYIYALLTGYENPPESIVMQENMNFNTWFPSQQIAMTNPLSDGLVEYSDKTQASTKQMAYDVTVFLAWAAEPELEIRRSFGIRTIIFLIILFIITLAAKRTIWQRIKH